MNGNVWVSHLPTGFREDLLLCALWVEDLVKLKLTRSSGGLQDHRVVIKTSDDGVTSLACSARVNGLIRQNTLILPVQDQTLKSETACLITDL